MKKRILISIIIGFIIAMIVMALTIYFGYCNAYTSDVNELTVNLLGIPIYKLIDTSNGYIGESIGINMGLICLICILISIIIEEVIRRLRHKE